MNSFTSALKPFDIILKIFGLPLNNDWSICGLRYSQFVLPIYCISSLILNSVINGAVFVTAIDLLWGIIMLVSEFPTGSEEVSRIMLAYLVNKLYRQLMLSAVPIIFALHVYMTKNWKELWLTFLNIQDGMKLSKCFMKKCKRRCYVTIGLLILVF